MKPQDVLVIGGSGTLGEVVVPKLLRTPTVGRVRVLSRGEHRQAEAAAKVARATARCDEVDWLIGDVRDYDRVAYAMEGCETVFNFAAVKSVDRAEYDCEEAVKTIVDGARHVIMAAKKEGVSRCVLTTTDKACSPHNLYGAAKMCAEKLWISEGNKGASKTRFSCMRYGNVLASQGSVLQAWADRIDTGLPPKVTDLNHTRFFISPEAAGSFVVDRWKEMTGGEVFIPKMYSTSLGELYGAFISTRENLPERINLEEIGPRPGEKVHEALISEAEAHLITDCGEYFIRWPENPHFPVSTRGEYGVDAYTSETARRFLGYELVNMMKGTK